MKASELIQHCREQRQGTPEGDLRDPQLLGELLTEVLDVRLAELASCARGPSGGRYDSTLGRVVPTEPAVPAPDPTEDRLACQIATLIGYAEDAGQR
jgi:hypothetical protein